MAPARREQLNEAAPGAKRTRPKSPHIMYAGELAQRLGITLDTFYRTRGRLHQEGMPPTLTRHRPFRFNRQKMEAWLNRDRDLPPVANDVAPTQPGSIDEHRALCARAYGQT